MNITQQDVIDLFHYKNGDLYWKLKSTNRKIGKPAGWISNTHSGPRKMVRAKGGCHYVSRLIFLYHHGYLPDIVDHADRNTLNNNIENIRDATRSQNCINTKLLYGKYSKYRGVTFRYGKYWRVELTINGKSCSYSGFQSEKEAAIIYNVLAKMHNGEFAVLNIIDE